MSPIEVNKITITVQVKQGRDLIAKDRNLMGRRTTSDPYGRVYLTVLGRKELLGQTKTVSKSLTPSWNASFRKVVEGSTAMNILRSPQPLQLEMNLFDSDVVSDDDDMGTVVIDFDPLRPPEESQWYAVGKGSGDRYCKNAKGEVELSVSVSVTKALSLVRGNQHSLRHHRNIQLGLSWDMERGQAFDLDASCVAIDKNGSLSWNNTVYYGNLFNTNHSIIHSGDEREGDAVGDDETVSVRLDQVPPTIVALYFILTMATPNKTFSQVKSTRVRVRDTDTNQVFCSFVPHQELGGSNATCMFLCRLARANNEWVLSPIGDTDSHSRDLGVVIPELKSYTRDLIPSITVDPTERMAVLRKGGTIRMRDFAATPDGSIPPWITLGLGWDITDGVNIDLDASVIMLGKDYDLKEIVFYGHLQADDGSIVHSGDERSGGASGDDETIQLCLGAVRPDVEYLGFTINSYSGQELDDVDAASCHLFNKDTGVDIAKYTLTNAAEVNGFTALVLGCLYRDGAGGWNFRIIAEPAQGRTAKDNVDELQTFLLTHPPQQPCEPPEPEIVIDSMMPPRVAETQEEEIVVLPASQIDEPEIRL